MLKQTFLFQIKYPQHRDSGIYECQISTTPHMSHFIHLNVVGKNNELVTIEKINCNHVEGNIILGIRTY